MRRGLFALLAFGLLVTGCSAKAAASRPAPSGGPEQVRFRVIDVPFEAGMAMRAGDSIWMNGNPERREFVGSIVRYDMRSKTTTTVVTSDNDVVCIRCNEKWLVWETNGKLWARAMDTGKRILLSSSREFYAPDISGDVVAWIEESGRGKYSVLVTNLRTGKREFVAPIAHTGLYNNFVSITDGKLVWTDIVEEQGHYRIYDLASGKLSDYAMPGVRYRFPGYAMLAGDKIYSMNFDRHDEWDWSIQQFGFFSIKDRAWVPLTVERQFIDFFRVARDKVFVIESGRLWAAPIGARSLGEDIGKKTGRMDWIQTSSDRTVIGVAQEDLGPRPTRPPRASKLFVFE